LRQFYPAQTIQAAFLSFAAIRLEALEMSIFVPKESDLMKSLKKSVRAVIRRLGYDIVPKDWNGPPMILAGAHPDFDDATLSLCDYIRPYTMGSRERIYALRKSVEYIVQHEIPGDVVECGVWKGGSMMAAARTLMEFGAKRRLHLFDTFEGMSEPTAVDMNFAAQAAEDYMVEEFNKTGQAAAYAPLDDVKRNLQQTGYDMDQVVFVKGKIEETIPANAPEKIALLRLDTDWYESTYHELVHLYPRLSVGGVLIIDDYGHWAGCRKAVDQYIQERRIKILLNRIDYTARIGVKLAPCLE
jgi:O-methyltransferase